MLNQCSPRAGQSRKLHFSFSFFLLLFRCLCLLHVAFLGRKSHLLPYFSSVCIMFRFLDLLILLPSSKLYLSICSLCHAGGSERFIKDLLFSWALSSYIFFLVSSLFNYLQHCIASGTCVLGEYILKMKQRLHKLRDLTHEFYSILKGKYC